MCIWWNWYYSRNYKQLNSFKQRQLYFLYIYKHNNIITLYFVWIICCNVECENHRCGKLPTKKTIIILISMFNFCVYFSHSATEHYCDDYLWKLFLNYLYNFRSRNLNNFLSFKIHLWMLFMLFIHLCILFIERIFCLLFLIKSETSKVKTFQLFINY